MAARVAALALAAFLAGCSGSAPESAEAPPPPKESPELYHRVLVESPGRGDHGAFVAFVGDAVLEVAGEQYRVTRVYDQNFRILGFYLESGACYALRIGPGGEEIEEFLGNHEPPVCVERICKVDGPFLFQRGL